MSEVEKRGADLTDIEDDDSRWLAGTPVVPGHFDQRRLSERLACFDDDRLEPLELQRKDALERT